MNQMRVLTYLFEVRDSSGVIIWGVIWQADVEETRVFKRDKFVHIILGWAYKEQIICLKVH